MVIRELSKEKIKLRKTDPVRSRVYGNIVNELKSLEKEKSIQATKEAIIPIAKNIIKKYETVINLNKESEVAKQYAEEIIIYEEFLPEMVNEAELGRFINESKIPEDMEGKKSFGYMMKLIKEKYGDTVDMGVAVRLLKGER